MSSVPAGGLGRSVLVRLRRRRPPTAEAVPPEPTVVDRPGGTVCLAPAMMLYLDPDGDVRPCCKNHVALGNIAKTRLPDIWWGQSRRLLEDRLEAGDFALGCVQCGAEVEAEGPDLAYPANFERYAPHLAPTRPERWPLRMEFNLSNSCNLQCIQCNGLLSSSIRLHREGRPPLPKVYDDRFFEDLEQFIPHLVDAQFAGGEPFMAAETYRVWDLIARLNPDLSCTTVTNATQWNRRVREVIETLAMGFVFSIDGVTKAAYEAVRIGADFDAVMTNIDRYSAIARGNGRYVAVNYCHMVQNYEGLADVLRWAEERELFVNVSVVRDPATCSLAAADDDVLRDALRLYEGQHDAVVADLALNLPTWQAEVARIRRWLGVGVEGRLDLWGEPNYVVERRHTRAVRAAELFGRRTSGRVVAEATLDHFSRVEVANEAFAALVGAEPDALVGRNANTDLLAMVSADGDVDVVVTPLSEAEDVLEADLAIAGAAHRLLIAPAPGLGHERTTVVRIVAIDPADVGAPYVDVTDWPA